MARIDFYVHRGGHAQAAELLACRVAEKALEQGFRPWLRTQDEAQAHVMDTLLWTFRDGSFLPHGLWNGDQDDALLIGPVDAATPPDRDMLINLALTSAEPVDHWERIAEVADQQPERLESARRRFRAYRQQGLDPHHHTVNSR
ncbi:MAG: DNA polymerase III subunit chi [Ectothiorhodospiraceae bacterium]|nr:DNA polymerase III subunit chi [Ectothiorhodospiraceae bacterium]